MPFRERAPLALCLALLQKQKASPSSVKTQASVDVQNDPFVAEMPVWSAAPTGLSSLIPV